MKLDDPFIRLPHVFEPEPLLEAIDTLPEEAWQAHPLGWEGHDVMPLVSADGGDDLSCLQGAMQATGWLEKLPGLARLLLALDAVVGRSLLLRCQPGHSAQPVVDAGYYWQRRVRVFMPLSPAEGGRWQCGDDEAVIPAGQMWLLDGWRGYRHHNDSDQPLVCLITDTVGSAVFWSVVGSADRPLVPDRSAAMSTRRVRTDGESNRQLETETLRMPQVMSPWELEGLIATYLAELRAVAPDDGPQLPKLAGALEQFQRQWQGIWARHADGSEGLAAYRQALEQVLAQGLQFRGLWKLANGLEATDYFQVLIAHHMLLDEQGEPVRIVTRRRRAAKTSPQSTDGKVKPAPQQPAMTPEATEAGVRADYVAGEPVARGQVRAPGQPDGKQNQQTMSDPATSPLRSVHTTSLPQLLTQAASSLLVTTYQAGKLVVVRPDQGKLNTHFRIYNRPMGLAADRARVALGTAHTVEFYRNMPDVAAKLEPPGKHDAAFLPRRAHVTGNIDIHEMAWAGDELWLVNTRFSCLCTLDGEHSFVPRWRPPFISGYAPEDRCHLNGLEVVDNKPKYVTALGSADHAGGWRENKAGGGILMDIESNEIICRGLSMPHSPRWYQDKLWVLESGNGSLAQVDLDSGRVETVAELPGFTRGLSFLGPFAFIGLSQVRESAVFSGIALTERVTERNCGVWVVDLRSGKIVAFLKFEDAVQEVFAVSVLQGVRFPDLLAGNDPRVPISYALPSEALKEVVWQPKKDQTEGS